MKLKMYWNKSYIYLPKCWMDLSTDLSTYQLEYQLEGNRWLFLTQNKKNSRNWHGTQVNSALGQINVTHVVCNLYICVVLFSIEQLHKCNYMFHFTVWSKTQWEIEKWPKWPESTGCSVTALMKTTIMTRNRTYI